MGLRLFQDLDGGEFRREEGQQLGLEPERGQAPASESDHRRDDEQANDSEGGLH